VVVVLVELWSVECEVVAFAVDLDAGVALAHEVVEQVLERTFLVTNNRCTQLCPRPFRCLQEASDHLLGALVFNLAATLWTVWRSDTGVQQSEVVV